MEIDAYVFSLAGHIRLEIIQQEHSTNQKLHKLASDFNELLKAFDKFFQRNLRTTNLLNEESSAKSRRLCQVWPSLYQETCTI